MAGGVDSCGRLLELGKEGGATAARPSLHAGSATPPAGPGKCSLPDPGTCVSQVTEETVNLGTEEDI